MDDLDQFYSKTNKKDKKILKKKKKEKELLEDPSNWEEAHDVSAKQVNLEKQRHLKEKLKEISYLLNKDDLPDPQRKKLVVLKRILQNQLKEVEDTLEEGGGFGWFMLVILCLGIFGLGVMKYNEEFYADWDFSLSQDFYHTLELKHGASLKDVKKSYRKLMKKFHPDRNPDCQDCPRKVYEIQRAYETLGDKSKKEFYDQSNGAFNAISSKATELTLQNYQNQMDSYLGIGVFQIYDSSSASRRFGSFFEDMISRFEYIDFYRVNSKTQGKLLGRLPYGSPLLPFVYFRDSFSGNSDIFEYNAMGHRNPVKDLEKSLLTFIPKRYAKIEEKDLLKEGSGFDDYDKEKLEKYDFVVFFDNINKKSNEVKLRLLYTILLFEGFFNLKTVLVDTSNGSNKRTLTLNLSQAKYRLSLSKVSFKKALLLATKMFYFDQITKNEQIPILHKENYLQNCNSRLAKLSNMKCFFFFKESETTTSIFNDSKNRNLLVFKSLISQTATNKNIDEMLLKEVEFPALISQEKQFVFQKRLKEKIKLQVTQKLSIQNYSKEADQDQDDQIHDDTVKRLLRKWESPVLVYTHSRDNDVLIETDAVELEDTLEDVLTSKMDPSKVFYEISFGDLLLHRGESKLTLFFSCFTQNLVKFDMLYWLMIFVSIFLMYKLKFSVKTCTVLFLIMVSILSILDFRNMVY